MEVSSRDSDEEGDPTYRDLNVSDNAHSPTTITQQRSKDVGPSHALDPPLLSSRLLVAGRVREKLHQRRIKPGGRGPLALVESDNKAFQKTVCDTGSRVEVQIRAQPSHSRDDGDPGCEGGISSTAWL